MEEWGHITPVRVFSTVLSPGEWVGSRFDVSPTEISTYHLLPYLHSEKESEVPYMRESGLYRFGKLIYLDGRLRPGKWTLPIWTVGREKSTGYGVGKAGFTLKHMVLRKPFA